MSTKSNVRIFLSEYIDIFNLPNFNEKYNFEDIDTTKFINIWN